MTPIGRVQRDGSAVVQVRPREAFREISRDRKASTGIRGYSSYVFLSERLAVRRCSLILLSSSSPPLAGRLEAEHGTAALRSIVNGERNNIPVQRRDNGRKAENTLLSVSLSSARSKPTESVLYRSRVLLVASRNFSIIVYSSWYLFKLSSTIIIRGIPYSTYYNPLKTLAKSLFNF